MNHDCSFAVAAARGAITGLFLRQVGGGRRVRLLALDLTTIFLNSICDSLFTSASDAATHSDSIECDWFQELFTLSANQSAAGTPPSQHGKLQTMNPVLDITPMPLGAPVRKHHQNRNLSYASITHQPRRLHARCLSVFDNAIGTLCAPAASARADR